MSDKKPQPDLLSPEFDQLANKLRIQAADLVEQQRAAILIRIHRMLGNEARKITDTEDVLSTVLRRVDRAIGQGSFEANSDAQFFAFVHSVIERSILEKARASRRLSNRERISKQLKDMNQANRLENKLNSVVDFQLVGMAITDPVDRELILLRGRGNSFAVIAGAMGMTPSAARKRWSRIRVVVQQHLKEQQSHENR